MKQKRNVLIGLYGTALDGGMDAKRWERWRPTLSIFQHEDLLIDRFEMLLQKKFADAAGVLAQDIHQVSPETEVRMHFVEFRDPWAFEDVYAALHDFASAYPFNPDDEEYLIHMTTGTHVAQICLFLLTESHYFPAKLIQTSPPKKRKKAGTGTYTIIDLDLSKYDRIATRFHQEAQDDISFLKSGIETRNAAFNTLIQQIEQVAMRSRDPMLLMGPTGAGKSQIARRIYELKCSRRTLEGPFVEANCATLRGDSAMSTLFGHTKGAFTGAAQNRRGLLRKADHGILFLDEIGELGLDEQAMLLHAIEEKTFFPMGSDQVETSDFQLICGTNRDLPARVAAGTFRDDLLARIHFWTYTLPGLRERAEDIEPNLNYELDRFAETHGTRVTFNKEARERFLGFAQSPEALWKANFRDLNAAVTRMATLSTTGRIDTNAVDQEIGRLNRSWHSVPPRSKESILDTTLSKEQLSDLDRFDRAQLVDVLQVCRTTKSLSEAGRILFARSRLNKARPNDADRLRKYLRRFELDWKSINVSINVAQGSIFA